MDYELSTIVQQNTANWMYSGQDPGDRLFFPYQNGGRFCAQPLYQRAAARHFSIREKGL